MNKRDLGTFYENIAAEYIKNHGGRIIKRNFRVRQGEIDIIAKDGDYLCFVEVKYRSKDDYGNPLDAVGYAKQRTICKVSEMYINMTGADFDAPIRYDVIAVHTSDDGMYSVSWLKDAYEYVL